MIVGVKCWYADGSVHAVRMQGRPVADTMADLAALPSTGAQCVVVYFDEHSTVRCQAGHSQAFRESKRAAQGADHARICGACEAPIVDSGIRYRRMAQGSDFYFFLYDTTPPKTLHDWLIGQTDKESDLARYQDATVIRGGFVNDTAYKAYVDAAMVDYDVTAFGIVPEPGTTDT